MTDQTLQPLPDAPPSAATRRQVRVYEEAGRVALFVDDTDVTATTASVDIRLPGAEQPTEVTVHLLPGQFAYSGNAAVRVDDRTRELLLKLGWTEPAGDVEWGYAYVDWAPGSVSGPVSELTARRKVDSDHSAELYSRGTAATEPGPWRKVETR